VSQLKRLLALRLGRTRLDMSPRYKVHPHKDISGYHPDMPIADDSPSKPLFVRLPSADAERLDAVASSTGRSKRQLVTTAVRDHLDREELVVGRISLTEPSLEVMTLPEAAAFLRVDEEELTAIAERGEVPGRRIGSEWRFSRDALLAWLGQGAPM
jgi:excisionase family DNA binding protein